MRNFLNSLSLSAFALVAFAPEGLGNVTSDPAPFAPAIPTGDNPEMDPAATEELEELIEVLEQAGDGEDIEGDDGGDDFSDEGDDDNADAEDSVGDGSGSALDDLLEC